MNRWLVTHSWEDFRKTLDYIGFASEEERKPVSIGDKIVCFGNGLVAGVFEAAGFAENAFNGWSSPLPFQVRLRPVAIAEPELVARPFRYKVQLEKPVQGSPRLFALSEQEFRKTLLAVQEKKKELVF